MSIIEDELRRVFDARSDEAPPTAGRQAELGRRIRRHQRIRVAVTSAAVAVALAVSGAVFTQLHVGRHAAPAPAGTTFAPPGELPEYYGGGKLAAGGTVNLADQQTVTITFTPTDWNIVLGETCAAPTDIFQDIALNGHSLGGGSCGPDGGMGGARSMFYDPTSLWRSGGAHLGQPMTIVATMGRRVSKDEFAVTPTPVPGTASIGIYRLVPWSEFPLPPAPTDKPELISISGPLGEETPTIASRQASDADPNAVSTMTFPLTARIEVDVANWSPGLIAVYLDDVQVDACEFYTWQSGCGGETLTIGLDRLAGFHLGQTVTLRVVARHFTGPTAWRVDVRGK